MNHFVYKTTTPTGKYYIGVHSTANMEDGYLGSGTLIKRSINKYGEEAHTREILRTFDTPLEAYQYEAEIVTEGILEDPLSLNLKPGGRGGWGTSEDQSRRGIRANLKMNELRASNPEWRDREAETCRKIMLEAYLSKKRIPTGFPIPQSSMVARSKSPEAVAKKLETHRKIKHQQGESNSQFGTCWVTKEGVTKKIKLDELDKYLFLGYNRGRK
jgi:hypothetical protein